MFQPPDPKTRREVHHFHARQAFCRHGRYVRTAICMEYSLVFQATVEVRRTTRSRHRLGHQYCEGDRGPLRGPACCSSARAAPSTVTEPKMAVPLKHTRRTARSCLGHPGRAAARRRRWRRPRGTGLSVYLDAELFFEQVLVARAPAAAPSLRSIPRRMLDPRCRWCPSRSQILLQQAARDRPARRTADTRSRPARGAVEACWACVRALHRVIAEGGNAVSG
jgi:hypothetical protein